MSGFNGAATFRLRKAACCRAPSKHGARFNGAATFRLRKVVPLQLRVAQYPTLQWGRNLSVAEGAALANAAMHGYAASMGPQPFGCGRFQHAPKHDPVKFGFNGAATFRLRKVVL